MKTLAASLLALGLVATSASAQWCPPGSGYGHQRPSHGRAVVPVEKAQAPAVVEPAPAPAPIPVEPVPQK